MGKSVGNVDATLGSLAHGQQRWRHEREKGVGVPGNATLGSSLMARDDCGMRGRSVGRDGKHHPLK